MKYKNRKEEILAQYAEREEQKRREQAVNEHEHVMTMAKKVCLSPEHPIPTTRREPLGAGLISGLSYAVVPSIFTLASQSAFGVECSKGGTAGAGPGLPGYLHVEVKGGFSVARNFVPGKQDAGGAFVPLATAGYATIGYGPTQAPPTVQLNTELGGTIHPTSNILAGLKAVMSAAALQKTVVAAICGVSGDDTQNNPHNPIQLVTKVAGNRGSLLQIGGTRDSNTGGGTLPQPLAQDPGLAKAVVANEASLANLVNPGLIATRFGGNTQAAVRVAELSHKLSASKLAQFQAKDLNQQVKDLIECGYLGAKDLLTEFTPEKLQVSTDAMLNTAYNAVPFATAFTGLNQTSMILAKLMADGLATAGTIEMPGYDYHGQGLGSQDPKDDAIGRLVGLALEVAHRKGQPMFVAVTTDGSVSTGGAGTNDRIPGQADSGARSMMLMFAIGATAKPQMNFHQIGKFSDAGAVDTAYLPLVSNTPQTAALCLAYNYASFAGRMAQFDQVLSANGAANPFKGSEKQYQAFAPKA